MDRKEILSYVDRIQEYYENGLRNDGENLLEKLIDYVQATARAAALREAAERAVVFVDSCNRPGITFSRTKLRAAILADKQEVKDAIS